MRVQKSQYHRESRGTLDFGEIEKDLAAKLSDNDISEVLLQIDTIHK
jgi:hypothetical protein